MGEYNSSGLDAVFHALSDPTRRAILARLRESDARVTDLARAFPISLNSTSKHVRVLESALLVRREVQGREHVLSLEAGPLEGASAWIDEYERFWTARLEALENFVLGKSGRGSSGKKKGGRS